MTYSFREQLAIGKEVEEMVISHFEPRFSILPATRSGQYQGKDFWFTINGNKFSVEIKADFKAAKTGNVFIETVSVGNWVTGELVIKKLGWAETCRADWLMYVVAGTWLLYITRPDIIRANLGDWQLRFRTVDVRNWGYIGQGILVPLSEFEKKSVKIVKLRPDNES